MKYTARFINGSAFKPSDWGDDGLPIVRIAQLTGGDFDNFFDGHVDERYHITDGDLLFSWSATLDSFEWSRGPGILNQHIFKVVPKTGTHKRFLYYSLKHHAPLWADIDAHGSTMRHIKKESLGNKIWLPSFEDQRGIASFLDREVSHIDNLLRKKENFVQALIQKASNFTDIAITRGLYSDVDFQDTDIAWLSKVPSHWKLKRAKYLFREANRPPEPDDGIITAFRDGQVTLREKRRTEGYTFAVKEVGYQHICKGDLVIHTMDAFAGAIGVSEDDGKATGEYAVCEARSTSINNHYFAYLLRCMAKRDYIFVLCPSVRERAPRFRFVRFAPVLLPVPPRAEQDEIVSKIEEQTTKLKVVKEKTEQSIERLQEFRSALITAAVTGQIDVANWGRRGGTDRRLDAIEQEMAS
ncbi:MAG: restriction endonuclease subunit S [Candidatus Thiodiazotropha endolucinida]